MSKKQDQTQDTEQKKIFDPDRNPYFDGVHSQIENIDLDLQKWGNKKAKLQTELDGALAQGYKPREERVAAERAANAAEKERRKKAAIEGTDE